MGYGSVEGNFAEIRIIAERISEMFRKFDHRFPNVLRDNIGYKSAELVQELLYAESVLLWDGFRSGEINDRATTAAAPYRVSSVVPIPGQSGFLVSVEPTSFRGEIDQPEEVITVSAYLDTTDRATSAKVFEGIDALVRLMGYGDPEGITFESGSIIRRSWARLRKGLSSQEAKIEYAKVRRMLDLAGINMLQAEYDAKEAAAVQMIMDSLADIPQACIRIGSILIVKYVDQGSAIVLTRSLSQTEIDTLEKYPEIQTKPSLALQNLAVALSHHGDDGWSPLAS